MGMFVNPGNQYRSARGEETRIRQGEKIGKVNNNQQ
jgi:hypothetical protein